MHHEKDKQYAMRLRDLGTWYRDVLAATHQEAVNRIDNLVAASPNREAVRKSLQANRDFNEKLTERFNLEADQCFREADDWDPDIPSPAIKVRKPTHIEVINASTEFW